MSNKLTTYEYINKSKNIHGDIYDYTKTIYDGWKSYVTITCSIHVDFSIRAIDHNFRGCQKCSHDKLYEYKKKKKYKSKYYKGNPDYKLDIYNLTDFLIDSKNIHGDRYDYSLVKFKNKTTKVKIICNIHGEFEQTPSVHISGRGCSCCRNKKHKNKL